MSRSVESAREETGHRTAREVLRAIDGRRGSLQTRQDQDEFLLDLIRSQDLQIIRRTSTTPVAHDVKSLRTSMRSYTRWNSLSTNNKNTNGMSPVDTLFVMGSSMLQPKWLTKVGFTGAPQNTVPSAAPHNVNTNEDAVAPPSGKSTMKPKPAAVNADPNSNGTPSSSEGVREVQDSRTEAQAHAASNTTARPSFLSTESSSTGSKKRSIEHTDTPTQALEGHRPRAEKRQKRDHVQTTENPQGTISSPMEHNPFNDRTSSRDRSPTLVSNHATPAARGGQSIVGSSAKRSREQTNGLEEQEDMTSDKAPKRQKTADVPQEAPLLSFLTPGQPDGAPRSIEKPQQNKPAQMQASQQRKPAQMPAQTQVRDPAQAQPSSTAESLHTGEKYSLRQSIEQGLDKGEISPIELIRMALARDDTVVADVCRESKRRPGIDSGQGRMLAPLRNARGSHAAAMYNKGVLAAPVYNEMYPPELPGQGLENDHPYSMYEAVLDRVGKAMKELAGRATNVAAVVCIPNGLDLDAPAEFVINPSPELNSLYKHIFNSDDWQRQWLAKQNQKHFWKLDAASVLGSLIAADVYKTVFSSKQPWDITELVQTAVKEKLDYGERSMLDKGYHLGAFLKQWNYKMLADPNFQHTEILSHAKVLVGRLALTLTPHLQRLRQAQRPNETSFERGPSDDTLWLESLQVIYLHALVMKGKIDTYDDETFEFFWPASGDAFRAEDCMPLHGNKTLEQQIMLTLWPGLRAISVDPDRNEPRLVTDASVFTVKVGLSAQLYGH